MTAPQTLLPMLEYDWTSDELVERIIEAVASGNRPSILFEPKPGLLRTDRAAWSCVEQCRKALGLDEAPAPIPVDEWIEHPLGIRFGITDLSPIGEGVLGAAYVIEREILISDSINHEGRFRSIARSAPNPPFRFSGDRLAGIERYSRAPEYQELMNIYEVEASPWRQGSERERIDLPKL